MTALDLKVYFEVSEVGVGVVCCSCFVPLWQIPGGGAGGQLFDPWPLKYGVPQHCPPFCLTPT